MSHRPKIPTNASFAQEIDGGRLHAPSAARNAQVITDLLVKYAPEHGKALELASGTGQHVAQWATALPKVTWQPSDVDPQRRASVDNWTRDVPNISAAIHLDATTQDWGLQHSGQNLVVLVNLLHLISTPEVRTVVSETAKALRPGGRFCLYGPFLRDGKTVSEGDARFNASLRSADPAIGYKDVADVRQWLADAGLNLIAMVDMPANNLTLVSERPEETT